MGTLKTTLKVESADLFPTPVSFTTVNNNAIGVSLSSFNNITIANGAGLTLASIPVAGAFLYVAAPSTNTDGVTIAENGGSAIVITVQPGDVGFIPVGSGSGFDLIGDTVSGTQVLNYYIGTR